MKSIRSQITFLCYLTLLLVSAVAFTATTSSSRDLTVRVRPRTPLFLNPPRKGSSGQTGGGKLLDEFATYSGEILNPYAVLKVDRKCSTADVKLAYRQLSRRYHPDGARNRELLPGYCKNMEDVRDEWERIKLAYEILSDRKRRAKYDRHEALSDPGAALGRAVFYAVGSGVAGMGKSLFHVAGFAFEKTKEYINEQAESRSSP